MLDDVGEGHSLFAVNYEDTLEKILKLTGCFSEFVFFRESGSETKGGIAASTLYLCLHVVA